MKNINLGKYLAHFFGGYLLLAFSKEWLKLNNGKPIVFDAKLENGKLILSGSLERLDRTKEVDNNGL